MPETAGKRERKKVQERKQAAREERRIARNRRKQGLPPITVERPWYETMPPADQEASPGA